MKYIGIIILLFANIVLASEIPIAKYYNMEAPHISEEGDIALLIGHRANIALAWEDNLLGLDGALNLHLEAEYNFLNAFALSFSRSSTRKIYNLGFKFNYLNLLFKSSDHLINSAFKTSISLPNSAGYSKTVKVNFQLMNSAYLFDRIEFLLPLYFTINSNDLINVSSATDDHTFAVGSGLKIKIIEDLFLVCEFTYPIWGYRSYEYYSANETWIPSYSASIQWKHYTHIFQLGISNTAGLNQEEFIGGGDNQLRLGFNIALFF
ncbi:MAG: DUF5777 family beta-barrel protein [Pseudomonadota bacterium]